MKFYAGIGSRQTPPPIISTMSRIALRMGELGWTLRSGGAKGADFAFEAGAPADLKEIYLPWEGFNNRSFSDKGVRPIQDLTGYEEIAAKYHPAWDRCSNDARAFHTRNVAQIRGASIEEPLSSLVICWTPQGEGGGGTGQAIRIARAYDIPVFDLFFGMEELGKFMKEQGQERE